MEKVVKRGIVDNILTPVYGDIVTFISSDGLVFKTENECLFHENMKEHDRVFESIKSVKIDLDEGIMCFFVESEEELKAIQDEYYVGEDWKGRRISPWFFYTSFEDHIKIGEWVGIKFTDGGDSWDTIYVYSQSCLKKMISEFYEAAKVIMEG